MVSLVGYTGFVGSNILGSANGQIDYKYNSKNIQDAFGTKPDLLIYSGLRAEKYLANKNPELDMQNIDVAIDNIKKIVPKKIVLISTIDVFKNPVDINEDSPIDTEGLHPYGYNRYVLEQWVNENFEDRLIVRLPGLYGKNLKKNLIYDYIHFIPKMLSVDKMKELCKKDNDLNTYYKLQDNGFYCLNKVSTEEHNMLKSKFHNLGFSALNFTDSRSVFQFYNLAYLWEHINICLENDIKLFHPATEPISTSELIQYLSGNKFNNILNNEPANYNYKTKHYAIFNGKKGYIFSKTNIVNDISKFISAN